MKLMDNKASMEHVLRSINATVIFNNLMMEFCDSDLPDDYNDNLTIITDIDDADQAPLPEERLI